jgi:putative hydrolase of the HAD superfamily
VDLDRSRIDAVFLDAGNTLVSMDFAFLGDVLAARGVSCTAATLARAEAAARPVLSRHLASAAVPDGSGTFVVYVRAILEALGSEVEGRDVLARRLVTDVRGVHTQRLWSRVLPGVPDALARLRGAGLRLVVVSNSDGTVEEGLTALGLRQHVDHVVDSAVFGVEKPHPAIFRHALALAGSAPERTVHVGDLYAVDVVGARRAGLHAVLLDPHDDWTDVDCMRTPDLGALADVLTPPPRRP